VAGAAQLENRRAPMSRIKYVRGQFTRVSERRVEASLPCEKGGCHFRGQRHKASPSTIFLPITAKTWKNCGFTILCTLEHFPCDI
jgi:hypothetical protein